MTAVNNERNDETQLH